MARFRKRDDDKRWELRSQRTGWEETRRRGKDVRTYMAVYRERRHGVKP